VVAQEGGYRMWHVVGQQAALDAITEQALAGFDAGRRHVGEQYPMPRAGSEQAFDERPGRHGLADRHCMDPDQRAGAASRIAQAETIGPATAIRGLAQAAPEQVRGRQRRAGIPAEAVEAARETLAGRLLHHPATPAPTRASAAITAPGSGQLPASPSPTARSVQ